MAKNRAGTLFFAISSAFSGKNREEYLNGPIGLFRGESIFSKFLELVSSLVTKRPSPIFEVPRKESPERKPAAKLAAQKC